MAKKKLEKRIKELEEELLAARNHAHDNADSSSETNLFGDRKKTDSFAKQESFLMKEVRPTAVKSLPFRGSDAEDFLVWIQNYEQVSKINGWSDDFKLAHISTILLEDANRKYWDCTENERSDWNSLVEALKSKFAPESSRASFEAALESRKKSDNESLDKYMTDLRTLARKAYPDWVDKYRDKIVQKCFTDGLNAELRLWVLQSNPKTSDEALQSALRSEANLAKKQPSKVEVAAATASQPTGTSELATAIAQALVIAGIGKDTRNETRNAYDRDFQYSTTARGRGRGRGFGFNRRGRGYRQGTCHACGQTGHFWRDAICPAAPRNQYPGNEGGARP